MTLSVQHRDSGASLKRCKEYKNDVCKRLIDAANGASVRHISPHVHDLNGLTRCILHNLSADRCFVDHVFVCSTQVLFLQILLGQADNRSYHTFSAAVAELWPAEKTSLTCRLTSAPPRPTQLIENKLVPLCFHKGRSEEDHVDRYVYLFPKWKSELMQPDLEHSCVVWIQPLLIMLITALGVLLFNLNIYWKVVFTCQKCKTSIPTDFIMNDLRLNLLSDQIHHHEKGLGCVQGSSLHQQCPGIHNTVRLCWPHTAKCAGWETPCRICIGGRSWHQLVPDGSSGHCWLLFPCQLQLPLAQSAGEDAARRWSEGGDGESCSRSNSRSSSHHQCLLHR